MTDDERAALVERVAATLERYAETAHFIPNATLDTASAIFSGIEHAIRADERARVVEKATQIARTVDLYVGKYLANSDPRVTVAAAIRAALGELDHGS